MVFCLSSARRCNLNQHLGENSRVLQQWFGGRSRSGRLVTCIPCLFHEGCIIPEIAQIRQPCGDITPSSGSFAVRNIRSDENAFLNGGWSLSVADILNATSGLPQIVIIFLQPKALEDRYMRRAQLTMAPLAFVYQRMGIQTNFENL